MSYRYYLLWAIAAIVLWTNWKKKVFANIIANTVIFESVTVMFYAKQTGITGGEIRHAEFSSNTTASEAANEKED